MRIAQVSTVATPVRGGRCGSVESIVWRLSRELVRLGHELTVFATAGSDVPGRLVATLPGPYATGGAPEDWQLCEWINLCRAVEESGGFDVLHSHAYLWSLPLERLADCPMVHTMHVSPQQPSATLWAYHPGACVTAISRAQWAAYPDRRPAAVIPHGVDPGAHTYRRDPGNYLCFLGRFIPGKGPDVAVRVARELGLRLLLAGPKTDYYHECIAPHVDGRNVEYVGYLEPPERDALLGGARALLYPVRAPEPFGLVLVEAMMSGTPVAGFGLGAVRELVEEGVTGAWEPPGGDLAAAVARCLALDRRGVRERAEQLYSVEHMARAYAAVYAGVAEGVLG